MVEEMYKEEFADIEMDSNSSSDNLAKAAKGDLLASEDKEEDFQQSGSSNATERCSAGQLTVSKQDHIPDVDMAGSSFQSRTQEPETEYGLMKLREDQRSGVNDTNLFPDGMVHTDGGNERFMAAAAAAYHMSEMGRFGGGSGVSLTLGLQHCEGGGNLPMSGGAHHSFVSLRGDDIYNAAVSSVGTDTAEFECMNNGNRQTRFSSSHLLHDFVA